jgi:hypothetical protein
MLLFFKYNIIEDFEKDVSVFFKMEMGLIDLSSNPNTAKNKVKDTNDPSKIDQ